MSRAGQSKNEVEVKIRIGNAAEVRRLLRTQGFGVARRRVFESNEVFDTPGSALRQSKQLLRLRRAGRVNTVTYKDKPVTAKHKTREEIEFTLSDPQSLTEILSRLGYQVNFRYEKFRTEFARQGEEGTVLLDETPIGNFLELEGSPEWIDKTAAQLGFSEGQYINSSYGALYFADCASRGVVPAHMVFPSNKKSAKNL